MTSAFDDDFSDHRGGFVNVNNFDDEEEDDLAACWEDVLDEEEEAEREKKRKEEEKRQKELEKEKRLQKREEERRKAEELANLMNAKPMSKEEQERAQLESDMRHASDLFGEDLPEITPCIKTLSVNNTVGLGPDSIDTYIPIESEDFAELQRRIVKKLHNYTEDPGYQKFIKDLVTELASTMSSDEIKKISNPLANLSHEKAREEKEAKKKAQPNKKSQIKVAKKTVNSSKLMEDYIDDEYQGFDDDYDFM